MTNIKHVGKMKNNSARVVVVYRTLPGDPTSALVVGTNGLMDSYHDSLMTVVESSSGQQADELANLLSTKIFPDGSPMLAYLHANGHLRKVPTSGVLMTPNTQTAIPLEKLNELIAQQRGINVEDLAVKDENAKAKKKEVKTTSADVNADIVLDEPVVAEPEIPLNPTQMRSKADKLFKEAQALRKQADTLDPPKSKIKKTATVE
jgi:hypothetical protein